LGDQKIVDVDPELLGIGRVQRMLGIDEGAGAALALGLGHDMQRERGLARALGAVDLDDAALGQAANAERNVEPQRAGRDRLDLQRLALAELHDRALAEGALDLGESRVQRLVLVLHAVLRLDHFQNCRHWLPPRCPTPLSGAAMRISPLGERPMYLFCSNEQGDNYVPDFNTFLDTSSRDVPAKISTPWENREFLRTTMEKTPLRPPVAGARRFLVIPNRGPPVAYRRARPAGRRSARRRSRRACRSG